MIYNINVNNIYNLFLLFPLPLLLSFLPSLPFFFLPYQCSLDCFLALGHQFALAVFRPAPCTSTFTISLAAWLSLLLFLFVIIIPICRCTTRAMKSKLFNMFLKGREISDAGSLCCAP